MNDLTPRGGDGDLIRAGRTDLAYRPDMLGLVESLKERARRLGQRGPWVLVMAPQWRQRLRLPPGQKLLDFEAFEYGAGDMIATSGIVGIYFSEKLAGWETWLADLNPAVVK